MVKRRRQPNPADPLSAVDAAALAGAAAPGGTGSAFSVAYAAMPPEGQALTRQYLVVREFAMWRACPIEACRRAQTCRGPNIDCFHDRRGELKQAILATFARWIDIAEITPQEFDWYWEQEAEKAGIVREERDA